MAIANTKAVFPCNAQKIWNTVTSLTDYAWISDLSKIEVVSDSQFVEYTKEGYATFFTVTVIQPYRRWEFDIENENMKGHWTGVFTSAGDQTQVQFTEDVTAKKWFMKPFVKGYLKRQQAMYIADLKKALL